MSTIRYSIIATNTWEAANAAAVADGVALVGNRSSGNVEVCASASQPLTADSGHLINSNEGNMPLPVKAGDRVWVRGSPDQCVVVS